MNLVSVPYNLVLSSSSSSNNSGGGYVTQSLSEAAHQKESPAGHAVTVPNYVEMAQVSMSVKVTFGRWHGADVMHVDQMNVELQRLNTTSKSRQNVIPQYSALAFQLYTEKWSINNNNNNKAIVDIRLRPQCAIAHLRKYIELRPLTLYTSLT